MPYNIILYFRLPYFHVSNCALFPHSTSVFSFYIDIVLTLFITTTTTTSTTTTTTTFWLQSLVATPRGVINGHNII